MQTNRFETFLDAIIAIIMTVLVLKIPQPATPTLNGILELQTIYIAYLISFLILFNVWYSNHNLFHIIDEIDNNAVWIYGIMTFILTLLPYFTIWVARNVNSIPSETMFGLIFILTHILNTIADRLIYRSNPYNKTLKEIHNNSILTHIPLIGILIGFILTYAIYRPGIYISCLFAILLWIIINRHIRRQSHGK